MNFIVGILMAVRSLTFVASFVSTDSSSVQFAEPQILIMGQEIKINVSLKNVFSPELLKLAASGTQIPLYVYVDLIREKEAQPVFQSIWEARLFYDFVGKRYCVLKSPGKDTLFLSSLDSAMSAASTITAFPIFPSRLIQANAFYHISLYSILGKTTVEALSNQDMDLMYYWDFKRPSLRTVKYKGETFLIQRK
jgi:hypothetical protein